MAHTDLQHPPWRILCGSRSYPPRGVALLHDEQSAELVRSDLPRPDRPVLDITCLIDKRSGSPHPAARSTFAWSRIGGNDDGQSVTETQSQEGNARVQGRRPQEQLWPQGEKPQAGRRDCHVRVRPIETAQEGELTPGSECSSKAGENSASARSAEPADCGQARPAAPHDRRQTWNRAA